ncbi:hypothetical protein [Neobacillus niacini]|jgi:hypothetical protein|uniref:hypothetical protein n=1 Tax=Neobacillus niacini TaxID=86668 RepID=UPI001C8DD2B7|nr:hypothetical protein [Neobacillus niacini]MBY0147605.1 hypothetical protein [Neobacillus niacini]
MVKRLLAVVVFGCFLVLAGCGGPVQDDILNYVNKELKTAQELEDKAVSAYEGVAGVNYTDDPTMHDALVNEVIPTYTDLIDELESVNIESDELKEIHEIYLSGANLQLSAFEKIKEAIEKQSSSMIDEANQLLEEGRLKIEDYNKKLDELAKENNVEIEKR